MQSWTLRGMPGRVKRVVPGLSETEKEAMRPEVNPIIYHHSRAVTIRHSPYWSPPIQRYQPLASLIRWEIDRSGLGALRLESHSSRNQSRRETLLLCSLCPSGNVLRREDRAA